VGAGAPASVRARADRHRQDLAGAGTGAKACRDGYTALFLKAAELFRNLATARADGSHSKLLYHLGRVALLVVDDWAMAR
jgi:DNA replication protein DnaC